MAARLGELLVAAGVITPAQLEDGLRAQVIHGARLGTNLVELGHAGLDQIATELGRQLALPPALRRHFDRCDPDVQARLPAALAAPFLIVPIGFLSGSEDKIMLAVRDKLPAIALRSIEHALGIPSGGAVQAVCPELRILYFLERVYAVPRAKRFLRVRRSPSGDSSRHDGFGGGSTDSGFGGHTGGFGGNTGTWGGFGEPSGYRTFDDVTGRFAPAPPSPHDDDDDEVSEERRTTGSFNRVEMPPPDGVAPDFELPHPFEPSDDFFIEETPVEHQLDTPDAGARGKRYTDIPIDVDTEPDPEPLSDDVSLAAIQNPLPAVGEEGRRFVETVADPSPSVPTLARMKLRRVKKTAHGSIEEVAPTDYPSQVTDALSLEEVARAIRRGDTRDKVGDLAIASLRRFGEGKLTTAVIFVVRDLVAIGWKGFGVGADVAIEDLAVPLDAPTVLAAAARERRALLIDGPHATEIDQRLWTAMAVPPPAQLAVAPVVLADHPVCLLYGHGPEMTGLAELFAAVTQATTTALARLLRAAQR